MLGKATDWFDIYEKVFLTLSLTVTNVVISFWSKTNHYLIRDITMHYKSIASVNKRKKCCFFLMANLEKQCKWNIRAIRI